MAEGHEEMSRILAAVDCHGDAYHILGLLPGVTLGDIKKKYCTLALLVHPDKCQHKLAHQVFLALHKAYEDLKDPVRRSELDRRVAEKVARERKEAELKAAREAAEKYEADLRAAHKAAKWRRIPREEAVPGKRKVVGAELEQWMKVLANGGPPWKRNHTYFPKERAAKAARV